MTSQLAERPAVALLGSRTPRIRSVPPYASSAGGECTDLAARAGLILDGWQSDVLEGALGERPDGRWSARDVAIIVGRQNGKNAILEARELAGLFLFGEGLIIHTAHQYKTAHEAFLRIRSLIEGTPEFRSRVKSILASPGKAEILLKSGQRLMFVARGVNGSVRGFSPDLVLLDEAYRLPEDVQAAILPAISARPNPQLWYTSSAPFSDSDVLRRIRERGASGESGTLAFFEWSTPEGADPRDRAGWAMANPALGIRLSEETIEAELESLDEVSFARERLGQSGADVASDGLDYAAWCALADPDAERGAGAVFGVATAPDRAWSAIAVAWRRPDGQVQTMMADFRRGATWVPDRVSELRDKWGGTVLVDTAARGLVPGADEVSLSHQAVAHNALADAVEAGKVRHGNDPSLNIAVKAAVWRQSGDTRVLDRRSGTDISPVVAAALAFHAAATTNSDICLSIW